MDETGIHNTLTNNFSKAGKGEWEQTSISELNGNEPFKKLAWKSADEISFLPYYDRSDVAQLTAQRAFHLRPSVEHYLGNRAWYNLPPVAISDAQVANKRALDHLANGADGVCFDFQQREHDLQRVLRDIEPQYCMLMFHGIAHSEFATQLDNYLHSKSITKPHGLTVYWDTPPRETKFFSRGTLQHQPVLGIMVRPATPVIEIAAALKRGVELIEQAKDTSIIASIAFSLPLNTLFLEDFCKLKALRMLWYQVVRAFGIDDYEPEQLHIHVRCLPSSQESYEPHGTMLKHTSSAMAGIMGGCNSITLHPADENSVMMSRIARNVSSILREESHFDKVADPLAGAYATESMIRAMAEKAWSIFQKDIS